jgi:hypothetical protein
LAICLQHEMDHLEGTLFIDHLSFLKSQKIKNHIKKHGYPPKNTEDLENDEAEPELLDNTLELKFKKKKAKTKKPQKEKLEI